MGKFQKPKDEKQTEKKKQTRKYLRLTITGILVVLLAVMPMLASRNAEADESQASILSATVEYKDIDTQIIGGGQLSSEASLNVRIPENVKLTQYLVGNGDTVKEGQPIAKVDKVSVMTAITEVQETLDYLAEEIAAASGDTASTSVKALAGGTVKVIYAREGESVQDVMLDHGALAILSLDDTMAVKIEKEANLDVGDTVCVTLADGTQVDGRVKTNLEGVLTITMEDDDYSVGAKVTVSTESGEEMGTGELYVFSPWSATAYSGTISDVLVAENDTVAIGRVLFTLEDTGNSAQFQRLIDQRQEYEELMQELFTMYRTETITAPCDGIVTGVDKDGAYLLSDSGDGWFVSLLSFFAPKQDGFMAYAVTVTEVTASGTELRINPKAMYIEDLAAASGLYVDVNDTTESWTYNGEITVYTQDENGLLHSSGSAKAGDILLAIGDEEQVRWFVKLDGSNKTTEAVQTESQNRGISVFLLSDTDMQQNICTGNENCTADSHNEGCPNILVLPAVCTGNDSCNAEAHSEECPMNPSSQNPSYFSAEGTVGEEGTSVNITINAPTTGNVGEIYSGSVSITGNVTGTWAISGADWLSITESGVISGTPTAEGSYPVTVTFVYGENQTATTFTLTIAAATSEEPEDDSIIQITTETLATGVVGQSYNSPLQATDGTNVLTGTWAASILPAGLSIDAGTGVISGTPTTAGSATVTISFTYNGTTVTEALTLIIEEASSVAETYLGYVAQVVEIGNGAMKVKQTAYTYAITDLNNLPVVTIDTKALTQEAVYSSSLITETSAAVNDYLLIVVEQDGNLKHFVKREAPAAGGQTGTPGEGTGGMPSGGSMPSGGTAGGGMTMGGMGQVQTFETYSLDKLTVASVTSQEHMTVSITVDELDITKIYVGQAAVVSVDALGGEQFQAEITKISNSGENEGGNSKFTVEITLGKSGDMLPGMYSSAFITLETSKNVPCVPVAALGKDGVDSILYTSYDAETGTLGDPVVVSIGVSDGENVQILEGFASGETCYYEYYDTYIGSDAPQKQGRGFNFGKMLGRR